MWATANSAVDRIIQQIFRIFSRSIQFNPENIRRRLEIIEKMQKKNIFRRFYRDARHHPHPTPTALQRWHIYTFRTFSNNAGDVSHNMWGILLRREIYLTLKRMQKNYVRCIRLWVGYTWSISKDITFLYVFSPMRI